jgi:hypothetical protein
LFTVRVLFSGWVGQFGWLFCAFGMLFVGVFDPASSIKEWFAFRGEIHTAEGVATGYDQTNMTINEVQVYETGYRFSMPDGREITDVSFSTGSWMEPGDFVIVEYVDGDVPLSRIAGMRRSSSGGMALIIVIFPIIGLLFGLSSVLSRLRHLRLLKSGTLTTGTLRSSTPTSTQINNRPVMRLTFEFEDASGERFEAVAKTHEPHRLEDEARELILYAPRNPARAMVLDELPSQPRVDENGLFHPTASPVPAALYLLLPGIFILSLLRYLGS